MGPGARADRPGSSRGAAWPRPALRPLSRAHRAIPDHAARSRLGRRLSCPREVSGLVTGVTGPEQCAPYIGPATVLISRNARDSRRLFLLLPGEVRVD